MPISFRCSNVQCNRTIKAPDHAAGRQARCPACGTVLTVPEPESDMLSLRPLDDDPPLARPGLRCGDCGQQLEAGTIICPECGWVNPASYQGAPPQPSTPAPPPNPTADEFDSETPDVQPAEGNLAADCLAAITYGGSNVGSIFKLVVYSILLRIVLQFIMGFALIIAFLGGWGVLFLFLLAAQCTIGGYFLRFYLDCGISSLEGADKAPDVPPFDLATLCKTGLKGLGVACVYILPIITLPLLPLGLLAWCYSDDWRAFDLRFAAKAALKKPVALLSVWGIMILWFAAMGAGLGAVDRGRELIAATLFNLESGSSSLFMGLILLSAATMVSATIFHFFMAVIFRCIGMLGRHNEELLDELPENDSPALGIAFIVAGFIVGMVAFFSLLAGVLAGLSSFAQMHTT